MTKKQKKVKKPMSKWKKRMYNLLFLIALGVFLYSGYQLFQIKYQNYLESQEKEELLRLSKIPENVEEEEFKVDWKALKAKNKDIVGWILVPDTNINYPIVHGDDNDYYLTHSFEKKVNYAGAIFVDANAKKNFADENTIIYGHNMWHKTMFTNIELFKEKEFYEKHPYVYIFTPEQNYRCEIFSIYTTTNISKSYDVTYPTPEIYASYLKMVKEKSDFKRDVDVDKDDKIVTLSTCSHERNGESSELRYLLHAKFVKWDGAYMQKKK